MAAVGAEVINEKTRSPRTSFQAEQRTPELAPEAAPPPDSPGRPNHPQPNTPFSNPTANQTNYDFYADAPPPLNYRVWGVKGRARAIIIWGILFFIEAGVLPLVLFYGIRWGTHLSLTTNLAIITSLIGTVSGLKMTQRTWYLWIGKGHEHRRPIGAGRWGVDCIHVLLGLAMFAFFTPLVIGSSLSPAVPEAVAMALPCVMITFGLPLLVTGLFTNKIRLPFRVSSLPPGQPLPPLVYMYVEDIVAVDGGGGHEFRQAWRTRYEESRIMRKIVRDMSVFWGLSGVVLGASFIAIDWTVDVDPGYGISYGLPWLWAAVSTAFTYFFVQRMLVREKENWVAPKVHKERILPIEEGKYDRPSLDQVRRRSMLVPRRPGPPHNLDAVNENRPLTESPTMHSAPALPEPARLPARDREPTVQIHERVQSV